jgi:hypothetical protein
MMSMPPFECEMDIVVPSNNNITNILVTHFWEHPVEVLTPDIRT